MKRHLCFLEGYILGFLYRLLSSTWSYKLHFHAGLRLIDFHTRNPQESSVFAHWHGDELALIGFCTHGKFLTMSSISNDGTIMTGALKSFGFEVIRGSSSRRGAAGLIEMIRKVKKEKFYVSFAADGPRGPRHEAKPGLYYLAYKAKIPIVQALVSCKRRWEFRKTWNKTYIPKPFARVDIHFYPMPEATKDNRDEILRLLNSRTKIS